MWPAARESVGLGHISALAAGSLLWEYKPKTSTHGLGEVVPAKIFSNNTVEFKAKQVAEQISHIPGSPS